MSRLNIGKAWLFLLLTPAIAIGQQGNARSRSRNDENPAVKVERKTERTRQVKTEKKQDKPSNSDRTVRSDRTRTTTTTRTVKREMKRPERPNVPAAHRSEQRSDDRNARNARSPRKSQSVRTPAKQRSVHPPLRPRAVPRVVHKAPRVVVHAPVRFDRRPVKRYVYRNRRYHRLNTGILSIGFYIRIPTIRWYVGRTKRFVYRQIVTGHPSGSIDVVSTFKRKIVGVHPDYVEVEFELDRVSVTSAGRFQGDVDRFPGDLRRLRAKIYRDGFVQFDRMLYVVGDQAHGFELLSTRYCGGDFGGADYACLDPRSGQIDFYRGRVNGTRYSRLLDLAQMGDLVPVALVPDEEYLGFQYVVGYGHASDGYYSGTFDYSRLNSYDADGTAYRLSEKADSPAFQTGGAGLEAYNSSFENQSVVSYSATNGKTFALNQRTEIQSLDN